MKTFYIFLLLLPIVSCGSSQSTASLAAADPSPLSTLSCASLPCDAQKSTTVCQNAKCVDLTKDKILISCGTMECSGILPVCSTTDGCVDLASDPKHCGKLNNVCASSALCVTTPSRIGVCYDSRDTTWSGFSSCRQAASGSVIATAFLCPDGTTGYACTANSLSVGRCQAPIAIDSLLEHQGTSYVGRDPRSYIIPKSGTGSTTINCPTGYTEIYKPDEQSYVCTPK